MTCLYCHAPAVHYDGLAVDPPMCEIHLDIAVLVEFLRGRGEPVTEANVLRLLDRGRANSDQWTLTAEQVPALLPAWLQAETARVQTQNLASQQKSERAPEHARQSRTTPAPEVSQ